MNEQTGPLSITIDFEQSHLFFPRIIIWIIVFLLLMIGIKELIKALRSGVLAAKIKSFRFFEPGYDKRKLFGSIASIAVYFFLMDRVGRLFPNRGLGFLLTSIPFMAVLSMLLVGKERLRGHVVGIVVTSVLTPLAAWILFSRIFYITLP